MLKWSIGAKTITSSGDTARSAINRLYRCSKAHPQPSQREPIPRTIPASAGPKSGSSSPTDGPNLSAAGIQGSRSPVEGFNERILNRLAASEVENSAARNLYNIDHDGNNLTDGLPRNQSS